MLYLENSAGLLLDSKGGELNGGRLFDRKEKVFEKSFIFMANEEMEKPDTLPTLNYKNMKFRQYYKLSAILT